MRLTRATAAASIMALLLATGGLSAQAPAPAQPAQPDVVATLRTQSGSPSPQDRAALETWIRGQVQALVAAVQAGDMKALQTARRNLQDAAGQGATDAFRLAFAETAAPIFLPYFNGDNAQVGLYLIQVLGSLRQTPTLDAIVTGLGSKFAAVRYWAARTILAMRQEIARLPEQPQRVIASLTQAGAAEGNPATAKVIYEALDFRSVAANSTVAVATAILDVLDGRLQFYGNEVVSEFYPDAYALDLLQRMPNLPEPLQARVVQTALTILEAAVQRWEAVARLDETMPVDPGNPYDSMSERDWHLRYQLAKVTQEAEQTLRQFAKVPEGQSLPQEGVLDMMTALATAEKVQAAFEQWQAVVQPQATTTAPAPEASPAAPGAAPSVPAAAARNP